MPRARARSSIHIDVEPQDIFDFAVHDLQSLADWLSSVDEVDSADENWPAVGSSHSYSRSAGGTKLSGRTTVLELDPPRRVVFLEQTTIGGKTQLPERAGRSVWTLEPEGSGTRMTMELEGAEIDRFTYVLYRLFFRQHTERRLERSLANLKKICEEELEDAAGSH